MKHPTRVAYLGGPGSFSQIGCLQHFPEATLHACATFAQVFGAVQSDECDLGLVPIENSIAGRVTDVHLLLRDSPLYIVGEAFVPIEHSLLGLPGADTSSIREVVSHPQALSQCSDYVLRHGLRATAASATSEAARLVGTRGDATLGAIAHESAAAHYGLEVMQTAIQDFKDNVTRFVILSRANSAAAQPYANPITTITLDFGENPAELHRALSGFAENNVKVTRIESYSSRQTFSSTSFMIDFMGALEQPNVRKTFDKLGKIARRVQHFGTYESANVAHPQAS